MESRAPIAWSWTNLAHGAALAVPAAVTSLFDPAIGVPLAVGVLPAAALGLRGTRRERTLVILVGAVAGLSIFLGALVAPRPVLAVFAIFALCVVVALATADGSRRLAPLALMLGLPLYGAGLSESSWTTGITAAVLILTGSGYACAVSLLWPPHPAPPRASRSAPPRPAMLVYGIQIGLAASLAAAAGFLLGVDHAGWACTAALLVSRPDRHQLGTRAWGRALSVTAGAIVACAIAATAPTPVAIAALILLTLAVATATAGSRWYIFPFFSTVIVLSLLQLGEADAAAHWFLERVGLTLLGVALALGAAWSVPALARTFRVGDPAR
ncbi:FUSC family protein [Microbacterium sp. NPDC058062]|uniref:FUSC family protein n=1 Tax=Microbacterium sp. NPDC058062 TaxID=3346320 RepID=UPI0036DCB649